MIRKILAIMLSCTLVLPLAACESGSETEETGGDDGQAEDTIAEDDSDTDDTDAESTTLGFSADVIAETIYGETADHYTGESNGYKIDGYQNDGLRLFFVYNDSGDEYPSIMMMDTINTTYGSDIYENAENNLSNIDFPEGVELLSEKFDNWGVDYLCNTNSLLATEFDPHWVILEPDQDYLGTISSDDYDSMYKEGRYLDLWNSVETYITENNPPSYDTAYEIEDKLAPLIKIWDQIEVSYDSVTDYATLYRSGITSISDSIHAVPHTRSYGDSIEVTLGFQNSDWIFFDKIIVTTSEDNISLFASSPSRDVLEDANIMEYADITFDAEDIDLLVGDESIIRFEGDDKQIDFILSSSEVDAMKAVSTAASSISFLCNYKSMYDRRFDEMYSVS